MKDYGRFKGPPGELANPREIRMEDIPMRENSGISSTNPVIGRAGNCKTYCAVNRTRTLADSGNLSWRDRSQMSVGPALGAPPGPSRQGISTVPPERPSPIMAALPEQGPVQVPRVVAPLVEALTELSACTPRTALAALLGALSALASGDADVEWPNRGDVSPLTLFILLLAQSGNRKSSAWSRGFDGHRRADRQVTARWEAAKASHQAFVAAAKGNRGEDSDSDMRVPLDSSPVLLRRDATVESLVRRLARGRSAQCWETSEAGTLIGGWSLSRDNRAKTLAVLQDIWTDGIVQIDRVKDDLEIAVSGARLTIAWACQPDVGRALILGHAAANGFAARCLLLSEDHLPKYRPSPGAWPDGWSAQRVLQQFSDWVVEVRAAQDYVHKGRQEGPGRTTYQPSQDAWEAVDAAGRLAHEEASDEDLTHHERSFLARVGENIVRVGAVLAYYRKAWHGGDPIISLEDVHDARSLVQSCYDELKRQGVWATATADAAAATWAAKRLSTLSARYKGSRPGSWRINHWLGSESSGPAKNLRGDPEARGRIIGLLESHGWIIPAGRGAWTINPSTGDE